MSEIRATSSPIQALSGQSTPRVRTTESSAPRETFVPSDKSTAIVRFNPAQMQASAAAPAQNAQSKDGVKKWTILVYSAGDNNLKDALIGNLKDCEKIGSDPTMNIVSQLDKGGSDGASRILIQHDETPDNDIHSPAVQQLGTVDMADPKTLSDFIQWGEKNYPAENYMLIISDHGDGWRGAIEDDSAGTFMNLPNIEQGLKTAREATGNTLAILGFDACLMAGAEVSEQLKNEAKFMVASEETEGAAGWPDSHVLSSQLLKSVQEALLTKLNLSPEELANQAVSSAKNDQGDLPTMTAIDMSKITDLTAAMKTFGQAIKDTPTTSDKLAANAQAAQSFYDYKDLFDFATRINNDASITDANLKTAAQGVLKAVTASIIAEQHSDTYPNAHGMTIELGGYSGAPAEYGKLTFSQNSGWDGALAKLQTSSSASAPTSAVPRFMPVG